MSMGQAYARSDDSEQPLHITADAAELNDKTGISIYRGNVRMVQGTTIITGDTVTIFMLQRKVSKMISLGELASYQETADDGDILFSEAEEMHFYKLEDRVELFRRGKITENDSVFHSEHIIYYLDEGLIDAGTKTDRVEIMIMPNTETGN
jgi:lipopolysaccharide export system protein LptA|tara:strand:- start:75618 stop:76070 length:453 start_codon:yes stop_codon:yes gene_type:complete